MIEDESGSARVEGAADQPPGAGAPRRLRGELCCFPRERAWDATESLHAGVPSLLWGGAPSPHPQLHLIGRYLRGSLRGVPIDGAPLEAMDAPLQGGEFCQEGRRARSVAGGACQ
jgi:hypothetical protein